MIPYVKNVDHLFGEMYRVLKSKGIALIIIMNLRGLSLHPDTDFKNRYSRANLNQKLKEHNFKSIIERNIKAWFWSRYYDLTSVYAYAVVTPLK